MNNANVGEAPRLLDPIEAGRRLSVSPVTLASWRCRGKGPSYVKIGGKVLYRAADLDAFVSAAVIDPTATAI
ncbi:MAG: hypothetical protein B7Y12_03880 [Rhizobiales bacterium 24-66-13]|jgi:hypothetical protein|uniref:helix-turn-helix transcriptional regulator n=1 Tax=Roseixanthobacter psychrophilus TaxID=3119917 RepID=UPI000BD7B3FD|nr:MAG: hypothetical protein B7Z41_06555 [Rhizobiales bacterium 12-66-7]OYY88156.1 MAG: hypothetical protein B7Y61_03595 [Rhizobiales bacterium 35-66-30]OYZ82369.1 MAG: hypothetical protein B7Y12_03880 [Rhizobiales bacterium 24-66-13]OZB10699.1 MAG: hypothetical protein B7X67_06045 [Rhizobiales bacterium 39-66-18]HQS46935.1 helix-turn-helix domain-containing protein [Xanthobacteraceae bacterium]